MGSAGALLTIGTAVIQGVQARNQAKAQKAEGAYQKQIYDSNARMAEMQADDSIRSGDQKAAEVKKQTKKLIGSQRAAMAAQGLDIDQDDALAIQQESAEFGAIDAQELKNNAWREAWGYRVAAEDYRSRGRFAEITAKQKARSTILTGGLSILNTFAQSGQSTPRYASSSSTAS